jgi:hypothetical protein
MVFEMSEAVDALQGPGEKTSAVDRLLIQTMYCLNSVDQERV